MNGVSCFPIWECYFPPRFLYIFHCNKLHRKHIEEHYYNLSVRYVPSLNKGFAPEKVINYYKRAYFSTLYDENMEEFELSQEILSRGFPFLYWNSLFL